MQTEFVRSLNCNYERVLLEKKPEERKYQYCILNRGGIRGLLPCSLRYINGIAYLYYDISSRQNIKQLYKMHHITREWITDFMWGMRRIKQELERFLLDSRNIIWYPEQIYQDLESNVFSFMYIPYYEGDNGFKQLLDFWVEQLDYEDEGLVECVYHMYEQYENIGEVYLQGQIYEDAERLEKVKAAPVKKTFPVLPERTNDAVERKIDRKLPEEKEEEQLTVEAVKPDSIRHFFENLGGKKRRGKDQRENYRREMHELMNGQAVAEETVYGKGENTDGKSCSMEKKSIALDEEEDYGRTIYIEGTAESAVREHRLCTAEGRTLAVLDRPVLTIGKKKGETDIVLEDVSVSRLHARIVQEKESFYLEDLNSTNGTFKNGLRLQPYEKRELATEDEVRIGRISLTFL